MANEPAMALTPGKPEEHMKIRIAAGDPYRPGAGLVPLCMLRVPLQPRASMLSGFTATVAYYLQP
jgi:hypothetical protein